MTAQAQSYLRLLDIVMMKGANETMELFTCDVDASDIKVDRYEKRVQHKND